MSYIHFGSIGDIWKHLPLAEFLGLEQPKIYVETNSGSGIYTLSATPEQQYGVYSFFKNCRKSPLLKESAYYCSLASHSVWENRLKLYLGSPALALSLLKENDTRFLFYDLDSKALDNLRQYTRGQEMEGRCRFRTRAR